MRKILLILALIVSIASCKKSMDSTPKDHQRAAYFVGAIGSGGDTVFTPGMWARVETVGLVVAEDSKLRAELMSYQNIGGIAYYTVRMTNKQPYQVILRWGWDNINPTSIQPNDSTANTDQSDVLKPSQVKVYTVIGLPKIGRIKVQAQHINNDGANSSTLIVEITAAVLPVTYLAHKASYDDVLHIVTLSFTVDDPTQADTYVIQRQTNGPREVIYQFTSDKKTKSYNIPIFTDENN